METILESTNIECNKDNEDDDSYRDSKLKIEVHKSLDLTCQVKECKYGKVKWVIVKKLLEKQGGSDLWFWFTSNNYTTCGWVGVWDTWVPWK